MRVVVQFRFANAATLTPPAVPPQYKPNSHYWNEQAPARHHYCRNFSRGTQPHSPPRPIVRRDHTRWERIPRPYPRSPDWTVTPTPHPTPRTTVRSAPALRHAGARCSPVASVFPPHLHGRGRWSPGGAARLGHARRSGWSSRRPCSPWPWRRGVSVTALPLRPRAPGQRRAPGTSGSTPGWARANTLARAVQIGFGSRGPVDRTEKLLEIGRRIPVVLVPSVPWVLTARSLKCSP
jgi:hypothetical protein